MKFDYSLKDNYFKMYGEANYFFSYKKQFAKSKRKKIKNIFNEMIIYTLIVLIMAIIYFIINEGVFDFVLNILLCYFAIMVGAFTISLISYFQNKKQNTVGTITINKTGITDEGKIITKVLWEQIELIGITKNTLVMIVKDSPILIILEPKEKVIEEIKKYTDVKIIRG